MVVLGQNAHFFTNLVRTGGSRSEIMSRLLAIWCVVSEKAAGWLAVSSRMWGKYLD